jgi:ribonuclease Z
MMFEIASICSGVIMHARRKSMLSKSATYYVHPSIEQKLRQAKAAFEELNEAHIPMNIIPFLPESFVDISPNYFVRSFNTTHRVLSQGYALYSKGTKTLKPEYRSLSSIELRNLSQKGINIKDQSEPTLELVYTGDTTIDAILDPHNSFIFTAPMLIIESTYLDGDISKAKQWGHIHLQEIIANLHLFQNEKIVLCHISSKYNPCSKAFRIVKEQVPQEYWSRIYLSLHSFGSGQMLTSLNDVNIQECVTKEVGWGWGTPSKEKNQSLKNEK